MNTITRCLAILLAVVAITTARVQAQVPLVIASVSVPGNSTLTSPWNAAASVSKLRADLAVASVALLNNAAVDIEIGFEYSPAGANTPRVLASVRHTGTSALAGTPATVAPWIQLTQGWIDWCVSNNYEIRLFLKNYAAAAFVAGASWQRS